MPGGAVQVGDSVWSPDFADWPATVEANVSAIEGWNRSVGGVSVGELRSLAMHESLGLAAAYCESLGIPFEPPRPGAPIIATGHQPDLYHPGVWIKVFAMRKLAAQVEGVALNLVVDTDAFESVSLRVPRRGRPVRVAEIPLSSATQAGTFAGAPVPSEHELERFTKASEEAVAALEAPTANACFRGARSAFEASASRSSNLADFMTLSRRLYEGDSARYLELPVSKLSTTEGFARFAAEIIGDAREFALAFNDALHEYRAARSITNKAQPFPDLKVNGDVVELPFWLLTPEGRHPVHLDIASRTLLSDDLPPTLVGSGFEGAYAAARSMSGRLVPRAVTLSLFARVCLSDIFIHGTGGARYDAITDAVIERFCKLAPPAFVVASVSLGLPIEVPSVDLARLVKVNDLLGRARHNPDALLAEIEGLTDTQTALADGLTAQKSRLVAEIALPGAAKKDLGIRIREINDTLAALVAPFVDGLRAEADSLEAARADAEVLADRTYPYCLFDPDDMDLLVG